MRGEDRSGGAGRPRLPAVLAGGAVVLAALAAASIGPVRLADAAPGRGAKLVTGTPCTVTARACVDLTGKHAWLIRDGRTIRGPVDIEHGGPGRETPTGTFVVQWKKKDHRSSEGNNAPMPYAVFFAEGGIAFHEGSLNRWSNGCIRLGHEDAVAFYDTLELGDEVQVHTPRDQPGPAEGTRAAAPISRERLAGRAERRSDGPARIARSLVPRIPG